MKFNSLVLDRVIRLEISTNLEFLWFMIFVITIIVTLIIDSI